MKKIFITTPGVKASTQIFAHNMKHLMDARQVQKVTMASDLKISVFRIERWLTGVCFPQHQLMVVLCNYLMYYDIYKMLTVKLDSDPVN